MRNNDNITFIDHKGVSHNARVQSFREHRDGEKLVHDEPLVTLNYNGGPGGEPITLIDVPHISHPSRQENNPELPSYPLHAWKYEEEEHLEIPADHPVHDHFNEQPKLDESGKVIPKSRPLHEAHIAAHRAQRGEVTEGTTTGVTSDGRAKAHLVPAVQFVSKEAFMSGPEIGHPAHPETVKFPFTCETCGANVTRVASHHGGKQWEDQGTWQEHVCKKEDIEAFRKKLEEAKKPKAPEPSPSERLAAGEKLAPAVEPDVTAQLDAAGPSPVVEKADPEDAG